MTPKICQSVLPGATRKECREQELVARIKGSIEDALLKGYWYCHAHEGRCDEPVESDHGRSATCNRCGSVHIEWCPPIHIVLSNDKIIEPEDLAEPSTKVSVI